MAKLTDKNRLSVSQPKLCTEWNRVKNIDIKPEQITYSSKKKVWWTCQKCNNDWMATPSDRHYKHSGCPHCTKYSNASTSKNSLLILNPLLAKEWHPTKNGKITPQNVAYKSGKKTWWKCSMGHEWEAVIRHRSNGSGCPYCSGRMASNTNNLSIKSPFLAKEWDYDKNYPLTPYNVGYSSKKKVWWKCSVCNSSWKTPIYYRTDGCNCPKCRKIILKDGTECDSVVEAFFYLKFIKENVLFIHHGKYGKLMGKCVYDFYLPNQNKYVEVTCYDKRFKYWFRYLRNIIKKKKYVEKILKAKFEFIQRNLNSDETNRVRENRLTKN